MARQYSLCEIAEALGGHVLGDGKILINKAELVLTAAPSSGAFSPPPSIILAALNDTGGLVFPYDYYETITYGGSLSTSNQYTFSITRQLQKILDGSITDYGFSLNVLSSMVEANRAIIGSGKNSTYPMKLRLFYTKLH